MHKHHVRRHVIIMLQNEVLQDEAHGTRLQAANCGRAHRLQPAQLTALVRTGSYKPAQADVYCSAVALLAHAVTTVLLHSCLAARWQQDRLIRRHVCHFSRQQTR